MIYRRSLDSCQGDVWALGVLLYFLLTDSYPYAVPLEFKIIDMGRVSRTVFFRPPRPPSEINSQVNAELDRIAMRAIVVNPQERYATAEELLKDLEGWRFSPDVLTGKNVNQNFDELANTNR